mgnify:CR=1 FL=1
MNKPILFKRTRESIAKKIIKSYLCGDFKQP